MTSSIMCPACGSHELEMVGGKRSHQLTLGDEFEYLEQMFKCSVCGEEGDFANTNDETFKAAEAIALKKLVPSLIDNLSEERISMAQIERAFELPQRTLTRWKGGDFSATSVALLRLIKTFPFVVNVAEKRFNPEFASKTILTEALRMLGNAAHSQQGSMRIVLGTGPDEVSLRTETIIPKTANVTPRLVATC